MDTEIIKVVSQVAGIGGVAIGALLLIFRDVIRREIFPGLTREQAYRIIQLLIILTFLMALFGIGAWVWVQTSLGVVTEPAQEKVTDTGHFRRIYYQGFDFSEANMDAVKRAFQEGWLIGKQGDWEGHVVDGKYRLCNISENESASYTARMSHEASGSKTSLQDSMVTVRLRVEPPSAIYSGAGILFRQSADGLRYLAYVLQAGKTVSLLHRRDSSLSVLVSKEFTSTDTSGFHSLRLVGTGPRVALFADDRQIYSSNQEQQVDLLDGDPGVFAYSTGCFVFDDFAVYERVQ